MQIYWPKFKNYEAGAYSGVLTLVDGGSYVTDSLWCSDIQAAAQEFWDVFGLYAVDCDFVNMSGTGTVFFQNPGTLAIDMALQVSETWTENGFLSKKNMETIIYVEMWFVTVALLVNIIARQLTKFYGK